MATNNKPSHEVRLGRVKAVAFANETENGIRYGVSFSKLYKDDNGAWRSGSSFDRQDLPLIAECARELHVALYRGRENGQS